MEDRRNARLDALAGHAAYSSGVTGAIVGVAGLTIRVAAAAIEDADLIARIAARHRVEVEGHSADIRFVVDRTPGLWRDESAEPRVSVHGSDAVVEHRDFAARIPREGVGTVAIGARRMLSVENLVRVVVALRLVRAGGLLLHAAGAIVQGGAVVLFGPSGSGKTTMAGLARGFPVLGDDIVATRRHGDDWWAYSTPFGGIAGRRRRSRSARIVALNRLSHGQSFQFCDLSLANATAALVRSTILPVAWESDRQRALDLCGDLARAFSPGDFHTPIDRRAWKWLCDRSVESRRIAIS